MNKLKWFGGLLVIAGFVLALARHNAQPMTASAESERPSELYRWSGLATIEQSPTLKRTTLSEVTASGVTLKFGEPALVKEPAWSDRPGDGEWTVLKVPVCQPTINGHDYRYQTVRLFVGDEEVRVTDFGQSFDYFITAPGGQSLLERCDTVSVVVSDDLDLSQFLLQLETMQISDGPEVPDCSTAQRRLEASNSGIRFRCEAAGQKFGFVITDKPARMSEARALQIVQENVFPTIHGVWRFEGSIVK